MNDLKQVQDLRNKAQAYKQMGNHSSARVCFQRIIMILKEIGCKTQSSETLKLIDEKIKKYLMLARSMQELQKRGQPSQLCLTMPPKRINSMNEITLKKVLSPQKYKMQGTELGVKKINKTMKKARMEALDESVRSLIIQNIQLSFAQVVGMEEAKAVLEEAVLRPKMRPDLYQGIRAPPKGILLYGPPGNGKTYLCKALAHEADSTFFALSAAAIMNKFVGESQKMLKKVFTAAQQLAPSIIFIDEIDSMLTTRSQQENQSSRRLKTEFLVLLDGIASPTAGNVLVIGATNLPRELDLAARRRFSRFIYVGLPQLPARTNLLATNLKEIKHTLDNKDLNHVAQMFQGYSASQIQDIIKEVCMAPLRQIKSSLFQKVSENNIRPICVKDFKKILKKRKPMLSLEDLAKYQEKI